MNGIDFKNSNANINAYQYNNRAHKNLNRTKSSSVKNDTHQYQKGLSESEQFDRFSKTYGDRIQEIEASQRRDRKIIDQMQTLKREWLLISETVVNAIALQNEQPEQSEGEMVAQLSKIYEDKLQGIEAGQRRHEEAIDEMQTLKKEWSLTSEIVASAIALQNERLEKSESEQSSRLTKDFEENAKEINARLNRHRRDISAIQMFKKESLLTSETVVNAIALQNERLAKSEGEQVAQLSKTEGMIKSIEASQRRQRKDIDEVQQRFTQESRLTSERVASAIALQNERLEKSEGELSTWLFGVYANKIKAIEENVKLQGEAVEGTQKFAKEWLATSDTVINTIALQAQQLQKAEQRAHDLEKQLIAAKQQYEGSKKIQEAKDKAIEEKFAAMNKLFTESQTQMQKQFRDQQNEINTLKSENGQLRVLVNNSSSNVSAQFSSINSMTNSVNFLSSSLNVMNQRIDGQDGRLNNIEDSANLVKSYVKVLKRPAEINGGDRFWIAIHGLKDL